MSRPWWKAGVALFLTLQPLTSLSLDLRPKVVYGDDDRVEYYEVDTAWKLKADSTVALIRAANLQNQGATTRILSQPLGPTLGLCPTERFYNQGRVASCSGFLVDANTIVTAGHCITTQNTCDQTRFVFGYRIEAQGDEPTTVPSEYVFSCRQLVQSVTLFSGEDFAVIKLDRPVTHTPPVSLRRSGRPAYGDPLTLMGHPGGIPLKIAANGSVRSVNAEFMVTNVDSYGMNSGSAIFNSVTGDVEGILVRGERDYVLKDGCWASNVCEPTLCRGEDVTLIERVLPFLPNQSFR